MIFRYFLKLSNKIIVNSYEFKKDLKKQFDVNSVCIYNPLNNKEIIKNSKKNQSRFSMVIKNSEY